MMKFMGVRLPQSMILDLRYVSERSGTSKSELIRQGIFFIVSEFFKKEEIRQKQQERYEKNNPPQRYEDHMSLPDGW